MWTDGLVYHQNIRKYATRVGKMLKDQSSQPTYTCVHLRRGDFVSAGWLGKAKDLDVVKGQIAKARVDASEPVYLATDEGDQEILDGFRSEGIFTWRDFAAELAGDRHLQKSQKYLAFEDYVGLIEQRICAQARTFVGSECSSFTGGERGGGHRHLKKRL